MKLFLKILAAFFLASFIILTPSSFSDMLFDLLWSISKSDNAAEYISSAGPFPSLSTNSFIAPDHLTFYDSQGGIVYKTGLIRDTKVSASGTSCRYVLYRAFGQEIHVFEAEKVLRRIRSDAYPVISRDGRTLLLVTGEAEGIQIRGLSNNSAVVKIQEGYPLLELQRGRTGFFIGFLQGVFTYLNTTTGKIIRVNDQDSKCPMIKRIALNEDETMAACISGAWPERIILINLRQGRIVRKIPTGTLKRTHTALVFSSDGRRLAEELENGFRVWSARSGRLLWSFSDPGSEKMKNFSMAFISDRIILKGSIVSHEAGLSVVSSHGHILLERSFSGKWNEVKRIGPGFFLVESDDHVCLYRIKVRGF